MTYDRRHHRRPISTRRAFALAFDLAVRRDPFQSLFVPLLLHAPWIGALALLPQDRTDQPVGLLTAACLLGDFVVQLTVAAMLRLRARSVFNTPTCVRPAPVCDGYSNESRRVSWRIDVVEVHTTS